MTQLALNNHFVESDKNDSDSRKVLNMQKLYNEYLVTVQVGRDNFAGRLLF
jgi:hypothetical protein